VHKEANLINTCRVCGSAFFKEPLLQFDNMPRGAQFFPDKDSLNNDKGNDLQVFQCSRCGLVQLSCNPVYYYKEVIRSAAFSEEMKNFKKIQFAEFVKKYSLRKKKIVEIGCGKGEYMGLMQEQGVDTYGLEYSEKSVKYCNENKLNVTKGYVENADYKINHAPFDAFFILNFLEHLPDLNSILKGISNNLTDDAIGLIEVPNFDMILKNKLFSEFIFDHLFYFTKDTLTSTLNLNGFEIIECNQIWYDYIISAVVRKRKKIDLSDFKNHQVKIKNEIEKYISDFENKKVAIWGAGHQSFAIISLLNLSDKIKFVIDSATFKQNKFTPATHIPIVAPEILNTEEIDSIIVIAAAYSDEVAKIIKQKFNKIKVAILRDFGLELV